MKLEGIRRAWYGRSDVSLSERSGMPYLQWASYPPSAPLISAVDPKMNRRLFL